MSKVKISAFSPLFAVLSFILLFVFTLSQTGIQNQKIYSQPKKEITYVKLRLGEKNADSNFWYRFDSVILLESPSSISKIDSVKTHNIDSTRKRILSISSNYLTAKEENALAGSTLVLLLLALLFLSILAVKRFWPLKGSIRKWSKILIGTLVVIDVLLCINLSSDDFVVHNLAGSLTNPVKEFDRSTMYILGIILPMVAEVCVSSFLLAICVLLLNEQSNVGDNRPARAVYIRRSLYITSTALGVAVLSTYLQYSWSSIVVENSESIETVAKALSIASGIVFSILILLIYLPIWFLGGDSPGEKATLPTETPKGARPEFIRSRSEFVKDVIVALIPVLVSLSLRLFGFKVG